MCDSTRLHVCAFAYGDHMSTNIPTYSTRVVIQVVTGCPWVFTSPSVRLGDVKSMVPRLDASVCVCVCVWKENQKRNEGGE